MKLIQTSTTTTAVSTISFTDIPQTGRDLVIYLSLRSTVTSGTMNANLFINNDQTAGNYRGQRLYGNGNSASGDLSASTAMLIMNGDMSANLFSACYIHIPDYTRTDRVRSATVDYAGTNWLSTGSGFVGLTTSRSSQSGATTQIAITTPAGSNFQIGSTASLYTIG